MKYCRQKARTLMSKVTHMLYLTVSVADRLNIAYYAGLGNFTVSIKFILRS